MVEVEVEVEVEVAMLPDSEMLMIDEMNREMVSQKKREI
jgi:hypothetical protein